MTGWLRHPGNRWLLLAALGVLVLIGFGLTRSFARDDGRYAGSPLKAWFNTLRSERWGLCCSGADGSAVSDVDWRSHDGAYQVRLDGAWIDVPDDAVVKAPNLFGRAMVWPMHGRFSGNGTFESLEGLTIRCFMPGPMG